VALTDRVAFYVECKRVASEAQMQKRLSEARKQLRGRMPTRHGSRVAVGCIATDVTKLAFPHNGLTLGVTNEHSREVIRDRLLDITSKAQTTPLFEDCRGLINCWFQIHISSLVLHPATPMSRFFSYYQFRDDLNRRQFRAVQAFQMIFESTSKEDRALPPEPLTKRSHYDIPAGTRFGFDRETFEALLIHGHVEEKDLEREVGSLTIGETTHTFYVLDLISIGGGQPRNWREDLGDDPVRARLELLMRMYARRFPFVD
jgi:hypothetical protein